MSRVFNKTIVICYLYRNSDPKLGEISSNLLEKNPNILTMNVDNPEILTWLQNNESGVVVDKFPVFLVRRPFSPKPEIYSVSEFEKIVKSQKFT